MHSQQLLLLLLLMALLCPSSQIEIGMHLTVSHLRASDILRASVLTATKKKKYCHQYVANNVGGFCRHCSTNNGCEREAIAESGQPA